MTRTVIPGWVLSHLGISVLLIAFSAEAAPSKKLESEVYDIEQQAQSLSIRFKTSGTTQPQLAEHRLVDAEVLYNLKDYARAAILLLDYVRKYPNSRGYPEALFYLADSLFQKRDFLSARRYFRKIVNEVKGQYYQEALQRLVELSLRTNDSTDVKVYLNLLSNVPRHQMKPSVPYVIGKYHFFAKDLDAALTSFRGVQTNNKYYMHSQYFIGACLVSKKQYAEGMKVFSALLKVQPRTSGDKHIRDLTHLAVGRLLYHNNKITEAIDEYQKISRRSKEFDAALYEIAWAYIKAKKLEQSLRALDLLTLAQPDSPFVPEVKVLQGNLLIRLKKWGRATDLFTHTRDKFVPVHKRMKQLLDEQKDPKVFFDVLLARNLGRGSLALTINVPDLALQWVKERDEVKRALHLVQDVRDVRETIDEAKKLIARLERTVNSPAKIRIFPDFATAKRHTVEVENRLARARRAILRREHALVHAVVSANERAKLDGLAAQRADIENEIKKLPTTTDSFNKRTKKHVGRAEALAKRLSKLSVLVEGLKAELVAAEKYFADTAGSKAPAARESFRKEATEIRTQIKTLDSEVDELQQLLEDAQRMAGVGGAEEVAERSTKDDYRQIAQREHTELQNLRSRLSGSAAAEFDTLSRLMARCVQVDTQLMAFNKKLEAGVDDKLSVIRNVINEEKAHMAAYDTEAGEYTAQTDQVAGTITYDGFQSVAKRFYDIVVRSDVGVIDVAWALKDAKTKQVSKLVRQRKMDLKLLDTEFKEVLKEDK
ncbi:MAG: tetratricopeptide repeat protein [Deltaproteobacteria bacterium]|nr:tetratricopeptide repeat protein [Deltaproteobacteria bacterium]